MLVGAAGCPAAPSSCQPQPCGLTYLPSITVLDLVYTTRSLAIGRVYISAPGFKERGQINPAINIRSGVCSPPRGPRRPTTYSPAKYLLTAAPIDLTLALAPATFNYELPAVDRRGSVFPGVTLSTTYSLHSIANLRHSSPSRLGLHLLIAQVWQ